MWDVLLDAVLDTLKLFPFLFVLYLLIELMEHNTGVGRPKKALTGKWAPALGACTGLVPMCGFSVMAAKLYQHRHITIGTLLAVFLTTSDEALLVLLLSDLGWAEKLLTLIAVCGSKLLLAVALGYLTDALLKSRSRLAPLPEGHTHVHGHSHEEEHGHVHKEESTHEIGDIHVREEEHEHGDCACDELEPCEHKSHDKLKIYVVSPLLHALQVAAFVFLINLAFGYLFYAVGEERTVSFLQGAGFWFQPLVCALIGLIPNCAASVVLAETYALGGIGFGGFLAGLISCAGLGYVVLMRKKSWKIGLTVAAVMLLLGLAAGYAASAVEIFIR